MMRVYSRGATLLVTVLAMVASIVGALSIPAPAEACPAETENARRSEPSGQRLPDCRAYEQVSPVDKDLTDADGQPGYVQSSPSGESVTYYSIVPFPGIPGSSTFPSYLSIREHAGWSTQGLLPLVEPDDTSPVKGLTDGNEETIVEVGREEGLLLAPGAKVDESNLYIHNNLTGQYRLIAAGVGAVTFADATPDGSHLLFTGIVEEGRELAGVADPQEEPYLFEWERDTGRVSFVGEVEGKTPEGGTVAGSNENGGENTYNQNTISEDGLRIFFSEKAEDKKIYMREPNAERTVAISAGEAQWKAATPNGSRVFYAEGENLVEFNVEDATRKAITEGAAGVLGLVGISTNGSYAYFVAEGVLANNENGNKEKAKMGEANLYEWHENGSTPISFMASLESSYDASDWEGYVHYESNASAQGQMASRVSADGTKVLISSRAKLTNYENDVYNEIYLYDASQSLSATNPRCVSCNPTGAKATEYAYLSLNILIAPVAGNAFVTRNLSANGTRIFFQTEEALLPQANGQMNVYEWEQEGAGSCAAGEGDGSGGCLYLISTGQSTSASYFGDASADGSNVFFFTRQSLVAQDQDDNVDVYDAREDGGLATQNAVPTSSCGGEDCRDPSAPAPVLASPYSATFSGAGNLTPPVGSQATVMSKTRPLTRVQKLAKALKACKRKPKRRRASCRAQAQKKYSTEAKKSNGRAK